ncbi:unnamed protein product [Schistosoma margrebowiei]|uniref:Uncharacterized protein n=1 Tax=Schistosoma margrebowiei TaxID=48269 RepID=A0A183LGY1_9TREM|nr:unnamed protein product [Schistosoma margrebowiei]
MIYSMEKELLLESNRKGIKEVITSTCHEVLGHKKHRHKEWITADILDMIQGRRNKKTAINTSRTRAEKAKAQVEYKEVNRQVEKSIKTYLCGRFSNDGGKGLKRRKHETTV